VTLARSAAVLLLVAAFGLAACRERPTGSGPQAPSPTAVLGGSGPDAGRTPAEPPLTNARGETFPPPPAGPGTQARMVRSGADAALALWLRDGQVVASSYEPARGWSAAQPLEQIYGQASDPRIASNGQGQALAVWRHTVGAIQSLRYSRFEPAAGWSPPDVVPGALPRPAAEGPPGRNAPRLEMDAAGNVSAQWPSGFDAAEVQVARYTPGQGWTPAASQKVDPTAKPASAATAAR
jgi:hypothetical protein